MQLLSVWSSPGTASVVYESQFFSAGTSLRESITWVFQAFNRQTACTPMFSGQKEGGETKAQTGFGRGGGRQNNKQKQTKDKKKLQNSKNIIQPSTAKVQLSTLHYMTVTDCWQSGGWIGTQRAEDAEHPERGAQYRVKSQGGTRGAFGVWKTGSKKEIALQRRWMYTVTL